MKMSRKIVRRKLISSLLICMFLLSGCGKKLPAAPELIEPAAKNEAFRTVETGDVGNMKLDYGIVVPKEYAHFWEGSVKIKAIKVSVGDYVEAGQVLAVADTEAATDVLVDLQGQVSLENSTLEKQMAIYDIKKQMLSLQISDCRLLNDTNGETELNKEIAILEENKRFDKLLAEHRISDLNASIAKQQKIITDGNLVARHSGIVTFVFNTSNTVSVNEMENVCVIADYSDCYVELPVTIDKNYPKMYPQAYACQNGNKYPLSYWDYAPNERLVATSQGTFPYERMRYVTEGNMPEVGSKIPIVFYGKLVENVIVVGLDSVLSDSDGEYVYVKTENGHEKRYIETGTRDIRNVEVIEGLVPGELVEYTSEALVPQDYTEFEVVMTDYTPTMDIKGFSVEDSTIIQTNSEIEGVIKDIYKTEGSYVNEGDLICTLQSNTGGAALYEMRNNIASYETGYTNSQTAYEEQKKAIEQQMADVLAEKEALEAGTAKEEDSTEQNALASDTDAFNADAINTDMQQNEANDDIPLETRVQLLQNNYNELSCQLQELNANNDIAILNYNDTHSKMAKAYQEASKDNDGNGLIYIYAKADGVLKNRTCHSGKNVKVGDKLFHIEASGDCQVVLRTDETLCLGAKLDFVDEDGNTTQGAVCGYTGYGMMEHFYVTTLQDKVYLTLSLGTTDYPRYIVADTVEGNVDEGQKNIEDVDNKSIGSIQDLDENGKYTIKSSAGAISDVVLLPGDMVYTEKSLISADQNKYYVWKIKDGNLEKYYIDIVHISVEGSSYCLCLNGLYEGDLLAREKEVEE